MYNEILKKSFLFVAAGFISLQSFSDEGMWLPMHIKRLNHVDMQKAGLKLTAEEIYSINNSSLKDAIVSLGGFCTGEMISGEGLMLTNHHCAFDAIQQHSSVKNDYLTHGFWAMNKGEELATPGLFARFLVRMEDVSEKVLASVTDKMNETDRAEAITKITEELKSEAVKETAYVADIKSFFDGNEYYLFVYEIFNDVRLVGAPPSAIGKFGGDTDNWMWPRHTGDFSLFRVYMSADGKPASYSKNNVPYKPKHFLPISLNGINENDYTMVMGYPGRTNRYLTSFGVDLVVGKDLPERVKIREKRLNIMKADMDASDEVRIKYASKYAGISNYYKNFQGMIRGVKALEVYEKKKSLENEFVAWYSKDATLKAKYENALSDIKLAYKKYEEIVLPMSYFSEAIMGSEAISLAAKFNALENLLKADKPNDKEIEKTISSLRNRSNGFYKDFNASTDQKITSALLSLYFKNVPGQFHPGVLADANKKYKGNFDAFSSYLFSKSIFSSAEKLEDFLAKPNLKILQKDPIYVFMSGFLTYYEGSLKPKFIDINDQLGKGNRVFVDGVRKMQPEKKFYPNANSTMRFTYGNVGDYIPRDAVKYDYYTTIEGIIEKEDPNNDEFIVPAKLKELYNKKDYGQYADKDGKLVVAFISDNDITGGNSGSPVINAQGQLIGCAFDGNWEAMSGDIAFEPNLQRTISVDIRYVLFIIDKYAGATNLISEMKIISDKIGGEPTKVMID